MENNVEYIDLTTLLSERGEQILITGHVRYGTVLGTFERSEQRQFICCRDAVMLDEPIFASGIRWPNLTKLPNDNGISFISPYANQIYRGYGDIIKGLRLLGQSDEKYCLYAAFFKDIIPPSMVHA